MGFNLEDYELVEVRIKKFYEKYKDGRIITKPLNIEKISKEAFFCAEVWNGDILLSTGYAHEISGSGYVNKTSHVENCETSAIGRALANIGLHGNKRPSREEMQKTQNFAQDKSRDSVSAKCVECGEEKELNDKGLCLNCQISIGKKACIELVPKVYTPQPSREFAIKEINELKDIKEIKTKYKELKSLLKENIY